MGSMCRQQAAYNPAERWSFIAEAEYWEKLADFELAVHYEECNSYRTNDVEIGAGSAKPPEKLAGSATPNDTGLETIFAA